MENLVNALEHMSTLDGTISDRATVTAVKFNVSPILLIDYEKAHKSSKKKRGLLLALVFGPLCLLTVLSLLVSVPIYTSMVTVSITALWLIVR